MSILSTESLPVFGDVRAWLERALKGEEALPRFTQDESPNLGILRVEKTLESGARRYLAIGVKQLVAEFCESGEGEIAYIQQLLSLAAALPDAETVARLAKLARRFPELLQIPKEVQFAVLATLVDTPPPQFQEFWEEIFNQNRDQFAAFALSGMLAVNPDRAVEMLPLLPNRERMGHAAALKLDLALGDMTPSRRETLIESIKAILSECDPVISEPVKFYLDRLRNPESLP